jgi:transposase
MENGDKDYKKLYEEALLTISEKEEITTDQQFELDKLCRHLFGFKSEKRRGNVGDDQLGLFELGTTISVQEELSESISLAEKSVPGKRAKCTGRLSLSEGLRREDIVIEPV